MNKIIVGMGEALWDCLPEGKKIGGAPANFAYHASQFGFDSRVVSAVGADADGDEILDVFARKGLRTQIERVPYPTGTVQVTLDAVGVPCYEIKEGVAWDNIPLYRRTEASGTEHACRMFRLFGATQRNKPYHHQPLSRHDARCGGTTEDIRHQSPPGFLYQRDTLRIHAPLQHPQDKR